MNEEHLNQLVFSKNVVEFTAVANEFCNLVESAGQMTAPQLIEMSRRLLPLLYFKASLLPPAERVLDDELEKYVTELDYNLLQQKWLQKLGEYDAYPEVFDPEIQFGSETVTASISESILDIYQDLKDFITSYRLGNEEVMNDALAECSGHFRDFWGQRLVNVLRAVHQLAFAGIEWDESASGTAKPQRGDDKSSNWVDRFFGQQEEDEII